MEHALPYIMAICTILSMIVTSAVWIMLMSFKRGQLEAGFITRPELQKVEDRIAATYVTKEVYSVDSKRMDRVEEKLDKIMMVIGANK